MREDPEEAIITLITLDAANLAKSWAETGVSAQNISEGLLRSSIRHIYNHKDILEWRKFLAFAQEQIESERAWLDNEILKRLPSEGQS
jgi:hypothetical protein